MIISFMEEWARAHNAHPDTPQGLINIGKREFGISTGDDTTDAAIDAGAAVQNIKDADKLAADGLAEGNIGKIDQAIEKRPEDFTYRNVRGAVQITNNPAGAKKDFANADSLAAQQGKRAQEYNLRNRLSQLAPVVALPPDWASSARGAQYCSDAQAYAKLTGDESYFRRGC